LSDAGLTVTVTVKAVVPLAGDTINHEESEVTVVLGQAQYGTPDIGGHGEVSNSLKVCAAGAAPPTV
jgi:hypothetical protein